MSQRTEARASVWTRSGQWIGGTGVLGALGVVDALVTWELSVAIGLLPGDDISPPSDVFPALAQLAQTADFWNQTLYTLRGAGVGLAIALAVGVPLGTIMGLVPAVNAALRPTVDFLRPVPGIALLPLAVLLWGQTRTAVSALVAVGCVWPLVIQAYYGARALDSVGLDTARSFHLRRRVFIRAVVIPGSLPYLATGLRIAVSLAVLVAVSVELLIGAPGIGFSIANAQQSNRFPEMYALIVASGVLGLMLQAVFSAFEGHFLRWHSSQQQGGVL